MTLEIHRQRGHTPMRVVAHMGNPIAYADDGLHLDGLLHSAARHDLDERTRRTIEPIETAEWPTDFGLPLSTWSAPTAPDVDDRLCKSHKQLVKGAGGRGRDERRLWGWCASDVASEWLGRSVMEVRKKPALGEMVRYARDKTVTIGAGPLKAHDLRLPTVTALEVVWFALGDIERVRHLLVEHVHSIGRKRNIGGGKVLRWTVEACDEDRSTVADGRPMRRLPAGAADGAPGQGAIRPPYWHHTRTVPSVEPCR